MGYDFFREQSEQEAKESEPKIHGNGTDDAHGQVDVFEALKQSPIVENVAKDEEKLDVEGAPTAAPISKTELKKLAARLNDQTYEVPAEAKFKHKVAGNEVEWTLQQLLNDKAGEVAWDKKFSELDLERKSHKDEISRINKYITEFSELSKKDKVEGLTFLAKTVGLDPINYKKELRAEMLNKFAPYLNMNENDRNLYDQKEELEYYKRQKEIDSQIRVQAQAEQERHGKFAAIKQSHGIDDNRLNFLASELQQNFKLDVTPENVVELHTAMTRLDRVDAALAAIDKKFLHDTDKVTQLESLLRGNPQLTDKQLSTYADKLFGDQAEKALQKLAKTAQAKSASKPANAKLSKDHRVLSGGAFDFFND